MTVNERKKAYQRFEETVKGNWKYNVEKTIFNKSISKKGSFYKYATKGLKDQGKFTNEEMLDDEKLFRYYVAYLLNDNKEPKFKWWMVNSKDILAVYLNEAKNEFVIMMNEFVGSTTTPRRAQEKAMEIYEAFVGVNREELVRLGVSKALTSYICGDFKMNFYQENTDRDLSNTYSPKIVWLSNNDFHGQLDNKDELLEEYEHWGLPSLFSKIKFKEFQNRKEDNEFLITSDVTETSMKYIDVKGGKGDTSGDRIVIMPVRISELVDFMSGVQESHGTIDSLFTLNVRDRKKNKNKVSNSIIDSVIKKPKNFLMLNNGITAIVNKIDIFTRDSQPQVSLKDIKIINGQQTVNTLFKYFEKECDGVMPDSYEKAWVLLKAYMVGSNKPEEQYTIYNDISNASNSQNAIKAKDLLSTRKFNLILQEKLLKIGINYSYRDGVSDFSMQLSPLPKITLNELVKMHYIFLTGEAWKRGSIGQVFDSLVGMKVARENSAQFKYTNLFNSQSPTKLADQLLNISTFQLFYRNKKKELGLEMQGLDLLIYIALVMDKYGKNGYSIEPEEFAKLISYYKPADVDANNLYKSAKYVPFLIDKILKEYNLEDTEEFRNNLNYLK